MACNAILSTIFLVNFVVDDRYFLSSDYGHELVSPKCSDHRKIDYLWVIPRSDLADDRYRLILRLKTTDFSGRINFGTFLCVA